VACDIVGVVAAVFVSTKRNDVIPDVTVMVCGDEAGVNMRSAVVALVAVTVGKVYNTVPL
jgi:hypothetical protein